MPKKAAAKTTEQGLAFVQFTILDKATNLPIGGVRLDAASANGNWLGGTNPCGQFTADPGLSEGHYDITLSAPGYQTEVLPADIKYSGGIRHALTPVTAPVPGPGTVRTGVVRLQERVWTDAGGAFRPLGATLFWALWGWQHDQPRLRETFNWLRSHGWEDVRILADVSWEAYQIDSSAPDFEALLGAVLDCAYDEYGLRVELCCWGGSPRDPIACAHKVAGVVSAGRQHKVINLAASNESYDNGPADDVLLQMVSILKATGCLALASEPLGTDMAACQRYLDGGATLAGIHPDRQQGAHGERMVRQTHDCAPVHFGIANNEPAGPRSSGAECIDPSKLAMDRAMGVFNGVGRYVFHNANGVTGLPDPAHNREGDLWSVPNIDVMMRAVRQIDGWLPIGVEHWQKTTQHGSDPVGPHPLVADFIWSDGHAHGCDRCYGAIHGDQFVTMVSDVVDYVMLRASRRSEIQVIAAHDGSMVVADVIAEGASVRLEASRGVDYLVLGRFV